MSNQNKGIVDTEKQEFLTEAYQKLAEAEKQVAEGKVLDADEALERIKNKYL